jgi:hypothetical protein
MKILRGLLLAGSMLGLAVGFSACGGDVCEDASKIIADCTGTTTEGDTTESDVECTGPLQTVSQCIVDNEASYCDFLKDPTNATNPC